MNVKCISKHRHIPGVDPQQRLPLEKLLNMELIHDYKERVLSVPITLLRASATKSAYIQYAPEQESLLNDPSLVATTESGFAAEMRDRGASPGDVAQKRETSTLTLDKMVFNATQLLSATDQDSATQLVEEHLRKQLEELKKKIKGEKQAALEQALHVRRRYPDKNKIQEMIPFDEAHEKLQAIIKHFEEGKPIQERLTSALVATSAPELHAHIQKVGQLEIILPQRLNYTNRFLDEFYYSIGDRAFGSFSGTVKKSLIAAAYNIIDLHPEGHYTPEVLFKYWHQLKNGGVANPDTASQLYKLFQDQLQPETAFMVWHGLRETFFSFLDTQPLHAKLSILFTAILDLNIHLEPLDIDYKGRGTDLKQIMHHHFIKYLENLRDEAYLATPSESLCLNIFLENKLSSQSDEDLMVTLVFLGLLKNHLISCNEEIFEGNTHIQIKMLNTPGIGFAFSIPNKKLSRIINSADWGNIAKKAYTHNHGQPRLAGLAGLYCKLQKTYNCGSFKRTDEVHFNKDKLFVYELFYLNSIARESWSEIETYIKQFELQLPGLYGTLNEIISGLKDPNLHTTDLYWLKKEIIELRNRLQLKPSESIGGRSELISFHEQIKPAWIGRMSLDKLQKEYAESIRDKMLGSAMHGMKIKNYKSLIKVIVNDILKYYFDNTLINELHDDTELKLPEHTKRAITEEASKNLSCIIMDTAETASLAVQTHYDPDRPRLADQTHKDLDKARLALEILEFKKNALSMVQELVSKEIDVVTQGLVAEYLNKPIWSIIKNQLNIIRGDIPSDLQRQISEYLITISVNQYIEDNVKDRLGIIYHNLTDESIKTDIVKISKKQSKDIILDPDLRARIIDYATKKIIKIVQQHAESFVKKELAGKVTKKIKNNEELKKASHGQNELVLGKAIEAHEKHIKQKQYANKRPLSFKRLVEVILTLGVAGLALFSTIMPSVRNNKATSGIKNQVSDRKKALGLLIEKDPNIQEKIKPFLPILYPPNQPGVMIGMGELPITPEDLAIIIESVNKISPAFHFDIESLPIIDSVFVYNKGKVTEHLKKYNLLNPGEVFYSLADYLQRNENVPGSLIFEVKKDVVTGGSSYNAQLKATQNYKEPESNSKIMRPYPILPAAFEPISATLSDLEFNARNEDYPDIFMLSNIKSSPNNIARYFRQHDIDKISEEAAILYSGFNLLLQKFMFKYNNLLVVCEINLGDEPFTFAWSDDVFETLNVKEPLIYEVSSTDSPNLPNWLQLDSEHNSIQIVPTEALSLTTEPKATTIRIVASNQEGDTSDYTFTLIVNKRSGKGTYTPYHGYDFVNHIPDQYFSLRTALLNNLQYSMPVMVKKAWYETLARLINEDPQQTLTITELNSALNRLSYQVISMNLRPSKPDIPYSTVEMRRKIVITEQYKELISAIPSLQSEDTKEEVEHA